MWGLVVALEDEQDDQEAERIRHDPGKRGDEQLGERGDDGGMFLPICLSVFFVIAFMHLHGMADRPCRNEKGNDEGEWVQAKSDNSDKS